MKGAQLAAVVLLVSAGCRGPNDPAPSGLRETLLTVGVAVPSTADAEAGLEQTARNLTLEGLLNYGRDGRPVPFLAQQWSRSDDGLKLRLRLQPSAVFHDGSPVTAEIVRENLLKGLPRILGPAFEDIQEIRATSPEEIEIVLKQPSAFAIEALDVPIVKPGASRIGTGAFELVAQDHGGVEMRANSRYYLGKPAIDRIIFKSYDSVRSAWADLLRSQVDMLYEVGVEALTSLQPSNQVRIFSYRRHYAYVAIFNPNRPLLRDAAMRRRLNRAINREQLIAEALGGRGAPATGPIWPSHWAIQRDAPGFTFDPEAIHGPAGGIQLSCIFGDPTLERLALTLQRQLQAIGIHLALESVPPDVMLARLGAADFDMVLTDAISGPSLSRPYLFWHSKGPYNYGKFHSEAADAALDAIRHSTDDAGYQTAVARFQRAIVDDPPALFLAWSERARAVSTRFAVPSEPERDVWSPANLRLWRPVADTAIASRN